MKTNVKLGAAAIIVSLLIFTIFGCGSSTSSSTYDNGIPYPTSDVVPYLSDMSAEASSRSLRIIVQGDVTSGALANNAYAQAGIDLGYFEGFEPVMTTFRQDTLTALGSNESTFEGTYGGNDIAYKGVVVTSESNYVVKIWGIRPGEEDYRRWVYGDFIDANRGTLIIDPYINWNTTHDYPMTIKFQYDASVSGTKVATGGAAGQWSETSTVIGSTYFYVAEDDSDTSNTIVTYKMYQNTTNETTGVSIMDKLYGKFNRDEMLLHGREYTTGYSSPDSELLYVNVSTGASLETAVPSNIDASSMSFPATPEADYAEFPATSEFSSSPPF